MTNIKEYDLLYINEKGPWALLNSLVMILSPNASGYDVLSFKLNKIVYISKIWFDEVTIQRLDDYLQSEHHMLKQSHDETK